LVAIKFESFSIKTLQLKFEYFILDQLSKDKHFPGAKTGIPKVFQFDVIENKCSYMAFELLGPTLLDLFTFCNKQFSMTTILLIAIQMLQRIEHVHESGFIHRDIKPENFLIGINENSNLIYLIDFGLSKRYKDKSTKQHLSYRENRNLIGTARYASINSHLGIEQSRRDDMEGIGYVLVYFALGKLPWQTRNEKSKLNNKILHKKLSTPPEILCKKLPFEFSYYLHYCRNLKFEDRPDYSNLKNVFYSLLLSHVDLFKNKVIFDWFTYERYTFDDDSSIHSDGSPINFRKDSIELNKRPTIKEGTLELPQVKKALSNRDFKKEELSPAEDNFVDIIPLKISSKKSKFYPEKLESKNSIESPQSDKFKKNTDFKSIVNEFMSKTTKREYGQDNDYHLNKEEEEEENKSLNSDDSDSDIEPALIENLPHDRISELTEEHDRTVKVDDDTENENEDEIKRLILCIFYLKFSK
jgi:serine/threonine protein kinase